MTHNVIVLQFINYSIKVLVCTVHST